MKVVKTMPAVGRDVTVKELTVGEIRAWLAAAAAGAPDGDVVSVALFEEVTLDDLLRMTDITADEIAGAAPSELAELREAVKAVNRDFFSLRSRLERLGEMALAAEQAPPPRNAD